MTAVFVPFYRFTSSIKEISLKTTSILIAALSLTACASTNDNLQMESARSIGGVLPESVKVKNVARGMTSVKWDAESSKGSYKCSADDMLRRVLCVKKY